MPAKNKKVSLKSKIKKQRAINWGSVIVINEIRTLPHSLDHFEEVLKKSNPDISEEELEKKKKEIILKDNIFNFVMDEVASAYSIEFDEEELKEKEKQFAERFRGFSEEEIRNNVKVMIIKDLIYEDLAKEWNLEVSEEIAKEVLQDFLKKTGQSSQDLLNDPDRIELVRKSILEQTITSRIIGGFQTKIELSEQKLQKEIDKKLLKS